MSYRIAPDWIRTLADVAGETWIESEQQDSIVWAFRAQTASSPANTRTLFQFTGAWRVVYGVREPTQAGRGVRRGPGVRPTAARKPLACARGSEKATCLPQRSARQRFSQ